MDTNKMREEFIRAYRRLLIAEGMKVQESRFEVRDGEFAHRETAIAWWAWQASREAVVVELPSACAYEGLTEHLGSVIELAYEAPEHDPVGLSRIPDVRAAIEAAGLKVAP